jgi:hypothetical protein
MTSTSFVEGSQCGGGRGNRRQSPSGGCRGRAARAEGPRLGRVLTGPYPDDLPADLNVAMSERVAARVEVDAERSGAGCARFFSGSTT